MLDRWWWEIISKKKKSAGDIIAMAFFYVISFFYGAGLLLRNFLYSNGIIKAKTFDDRIISVGNITLGGTGKTPFTEELGRRIIKSGRKLLIVAKGYKRKKISDIDVVSNGQEILLRPKNAGDEPYMLARNLKEACVIVGGDKIKAIEYGLQIFKPDLVLLDDGFQKRHMLKKALNVVLIDAINPFGFNRLFPSGMLREPVSSLKDADAVVITNTNLVDDPVKVEKIKEYITAKDKNARIFEAEIQPKFFYNVFTGEKAGVDFLSGKKVISFSAIGNPFAFEKTLTVLGARITVGLRFMDHHILHKKEAGALCSLLEKTSAALMVTTEKDEVKLRRKNFTTDKIYALKTGMFIKNIKDLEKRLRIEK